MAKNTTGIVVSWIFGILALIFLIFLVNIISYIVPNTFTKDLVQFVNGNIIFLIIISLLFFLGSLFYRMGFPVNLGFPVFDAFGGFFLTRLLIDLVDLLDGYAGTGIGNLLVTYAWAISVVIFVIIIAFGYISIFQHETRGHTDRRREREEVTEETVEEEPDRRAHSRKKVTKRTTRRR